METLPTSQVRVVAAVVTRGATTLVCRRPFEKRHGGLWEFPGGKCEARESDLEAVTRELFEELGVRVLSIGEALFSIADPDSPFLIVFLPVDFSGEPNCHEHTAILWAPLDEIANLSLAPSDRKFVDFKAGR